MSCYGIFYKNSGGRWFGPYRPDLFMFSSQKEANKYVPELKKVMKNKVEIRKANWVGVK